MGIEIATLAAYAATASAALGAISLVAGQKGGGKPPEPGAPIKPPEAAKTPDADVFRSKNQARGVGGDATGGTMLTPLGGVPATSLNLGKNTLLGA